MKFNGMKLGFCGENLMDCYVCHIGAYGNSYPNKLCGENFHRESQNHKNVQKAFFSPSKVCRYRLCIDSGIYTYYGAPLCVSPHVHVV